VYAIKNSGRGLVRWLAFPVVTALLGGCMTTLPAEPLSQQVASIATCNVPGRCGESLTCEGKTVSLTGLVDSANIFDRATNPAQSIQKFLIRPVGSSDPVEVWAEGASDVEAKLLFSRVRAAALANSQITVLGKAVGVNLPITGQCNRAIKLEINRASAVSVRGNASVRAADGQRGVSK